MTTEDKRAHLNKESKHTHTHTQTQTGRQGAFFTVTSKSRKYTFPSVYFFSQVLHPSVRVSSHHTTAGPRLLDLALPHHLPPPLQLRLAQLLRTARRSRGLLLLLSRRGHGLLLLVLVLPAVLRHLDLHHLRPSLLLLLRWGPPSPLVPLDGPELGGLLLLLLLLLLVLLLLLPLLLLVVRRVRRLLLLVVLLLLLVRGAAPVGVPALLRGAHVRVQGAQPEGLLVVRGARQWLLDDRALKALLGRVLDETRAHDVGVLRSFVRSKRRKQTARETVSQQKWFGSVQFGQIRPPLSRMIGVFSLVSSRLLSLSLSLSLTSIVIVTLLILSWLV